MQPKNSYITDTSSINEIQASPTEFLEYNDTRFKRLNNQHWLHYRFLADWFSSRSAMVLYYPVYLFSKGKSIEYKIQRVNQLPKQSECKKNTAYYTMENSTIKIMSSELSKPRSYQEYLDPDNELEENNKNAEQENRAVQKNKLNILLNTAFPHKQFTDQLTSSTSYSEPITAYNCTKNIFGAGSLTTSGIVTAIALTGLGLGIAACCTGVGAGAGIPIILASLMYLGYVGGGLTTAASLTLAISNGASFWGGICTKIHLWHAKKTAPNLALKVNDNESEHSDEGRTSSLSSRSSIYGEHNSIDSNNSDSDDDNIALDDTRESAFNLLDDNSEGNDPAREEYTSFQL